MKRKNVLLPSFARHAVAGDAIAGSHDEHGRGICGPKGSFHQVRRCSARCTANQCSYHGCDDGNPIGASRHE